MNNYNPMLDYQRNQLIAQQAMIQNQLNQMNHTPQMQFNPYPQNTQPQFFVRQVGSVDEAKGYPIDPSTIYFFPDIGTGKIYLKRLNTENGKSEFFTYGLQEEKPVEEKSDPIDQINARLANIEKIIGGKKYDESVSGNEGCTKSSGNASRAGNGKVQKSKPTDVQPDTTDGEREE